MLILASGCDYSVDPVGIGEACRRPRDCEDGLDCINRVCAPRPQPGTPSSSSDPIPTLKPMDASTRGADAGADAG